MDMDDVRMKVVEINTVCGSGSTGRIAVDLANVLLAGGHACEIAYGHFDTDYEPAYRIGTCLDGVIHKAGSRLLDRQGFFSRGATRKLIRHLRQTAPDIVHLHNIHGHYLNIDLLFRYLAQQRLPVIWTLHDCWPFTGHCAYFDYAQCEKWRTGCSDCPNRGAYPPSLLIDNSRSNYRRKREIFNRPGEMTIVTPSRWLADLVKGSFLSGYDVRVIPNGIDTRVFAPAGAEIKKQLDAEGKVLLLGVALGGFTGRKGLTYFLDLAQRLPENYMIALVGVSGQEMNALPENIRGIGRTGSVEELARYYSAADVFVNPTLEDNFPTTNLEALACGTPVLTFQTGGSPEAIDPLTGVCVPKGDRDALLHAVLEMNTDFKRRHGEDCRTRAVRMFDKHVAFAAYADLYKELFNRSR